MISYALGFGYEGGWIKLSTLFYRYDIMMSCWSLKAWGRPSFQQLVVTFTSLLERESGYLELCQEMDLPQSSSWKENDSASHAPPSTQPTPPAVI